MAQITISELRPAGADLFGGSESFMMELSDDELGITGGATPVAIAVASSKGCIVGAAFVVGAVVGWLAN